MRVPRAPWPAAPEARLAADVRDLCRWPNPAHGSEGHAGAPRFLLQRFCAHYDTVFGTPGADDNAATLAITLEVARRLRERPAEPSMVIAPFDAEEPPHFRSSSMKSTRFVADQMGADLLEALVHDASSLEMASAVEHDPSDLDTRHLRSILGDRAAALGLHGPRDFDRVVREVVRAIQAGDPGAAGATDVQSDRP